MKGLIDALKTALKQAGLTYAEAAARVGMSESNLKRLFSTGSFSLRQVELVCEAAGLDLVDLLRAMESSRQRISRLTREQEDALVNDPLLLLAAVCVRNHWRLEDVVRVYRVTETQCIGLFARLDRLRLIELLPGNRYRLRIAEDFQWIAGGPIERFFEKQILAEFLDSPFTGEDELRRYVGGSISRASAETMRRKLKMLAREFGELHSADAGLPTSERVNFGVMLAMRPWELGEFQALRRKPRS